MTRLIVISSETDIKDEAFIVNELFQSGLKLFHLRKPDWNADDQRIFLEKIESSFLERVSVHQHHETVTEFGLKYCHIKENLRNSFPKQANTVCSTSFHEYNVLLYEIKNWDYTFLSPVFDSISKTNYKSTLPDDFRVDEKLNHKIFALGGITKNNIELVFEKGFYGAAVLGSVWKDPASAVNNFKMLESLCRRNVHMS